MLVNHILLAEDDDDDWFFFKEAINKIAPGIKLKRANDGTELIQFLLADATLPDIIFLDINMPRKNGYQCLMELRANERLKGIPVIVFSTSLYGEIIAQMLEAGAKQCLCKPNDFGLRKLHLQEMLQTDWQHQPRNVLLEER